MTDEEIDDLTRAFLIGLAGGEEIIKNKIKAK